MENRERKRCDTEKEEIKCWEDLSLEQATTVGREIFLTDRSLVCTTYPYGLSTNGKDHTGS